MSLACKKYGKSPKGIKANRIKHWRQQGIIVKDWDVFYKYYLEVTNCETCNVLLTQGIDGFKNTTKCVDHNHNIKDSINFRKILCNTCNSNEKSNNTSGFPNISKHTQTGKWYFSKMINKKRFASPLFETKEEANTFKNEYLLKKLNVG